MLYKSSTGATIATAPHTLQVSEDLALSGASASGVLTLAKRHVDTVEVVAAAKTLTRDESGKTLFLSLVTGFEVILPTVEAGLRFTFIVKTAPTSNGYTITGTPADRIFGTIACSGAENTINGVTADANDNVILVHNQAKIGDTVTFISDGANWYVNGNVNTYAAVTANG
jgi:hypothetical protein